MKKKELHIFDFEPTYPAIDNPLHALLISMLTSEEYTITVCSTNDSTIEYAKENAIPYIYVKNPSTKNLRTAYTCIKSLRKNNTIVHAFGTHTVEAMLSLNYYFGKNPFIVSFTSMPSTISVTKLQKQYHKITHCIAPTRNLINTISQIFGISSNICTVIPIGITQSLYSQKENNTQRIIITVISPLEENYSLFEILESLSVLAKTNLIQNWEVRFIGKGSLFSSIIEKATELGIVNNIALLGEYPFPHILHTTTVLIIPSYFWYVSQAIYGAIASRIPIIHTHDVNILDCINFQQIPSTTFVLGESTALRTAIKSTLETKPLLTTPIYSLEQTILAFQNVYTKITR